MVRLGTQNTMRYVYYSATKLAKTGQIKIYLFFRDGFVWATDSRDNFDIEEFISVIYPNGANRNE